MALRVENLTPKLLAVLLALVVYAHVATERESETVLTVPLRVARLPEGLVVEAPRELTARIQARGKQKAFWRLKVTGPEIVVDLAGASPGLVQRKLSPGDVHIPVGVDIEITDVLDPLLVAFSVDTVLTRRIPLRVQVTGKPPASYRVGAPDPTPSHVMVRGPSRVLDGLDALDVGPIDLAQAIPGQPFQIDLDPGRPGLSVEPRSIRVDLPIAVLQTRTFSGIPVRIGGLSPQLAARVQPQLARVSIRAEVSLLDSLARSGPLVQVDLTGFAPGRHLVVGSVVGVNSAWEVSLVRPDRFLVEIYEESP